MIRLLRAYIIIGVLPVLLCLSTLTGCSGDRTADYRIAVSQPSSDSWRETMNDEIRREELFHNNVSVEIRSAENDSRKQQADLRHFIDAGVDLILVSPYEPEPLVPLVAEARKKGIPVISFDRRLQGVPVKVRGKRLPLQLERAGGEAGGYIMHIEVDNEALGHSVAQYALSLFPHGARILEIEGNRRTSAAADRHRGFASGIAGHPDMHIVASVDASWELDSARHLADSVFSLHHDIDLVYAHSDGMAISAAEAAEAHGLHGVKYLGIDGITNVGIKAVSDSILTATFLYPTYGYLLLRHAIDVLDGKPYEAELILPPVSAVDLRNADILRQQVQMQYEETDKIIMLRDKLNQHLAQYAAQKMMLYAAIFMVIAVITIVFVLLRTLRHDRRHRRELTEKNEQLAAATQAKLAFYTSVSHDLRTPLTLITEPIEQVAPAENLTYQQRQLMGLAGRNAKILHRLIDQLLDFRKYETGQSHLHLTETAVYPLLYEWVQAFEVIARKRGMRYDIRMPATPPDGFTLALDAEKMERVVFNIISNAFKYTPDGGSISIEARHSEDTFVLSVSDTGRGISPDNHLRIFDRFYQVEKVNPNGSGIGLALTKAFVELHGGKITVESEVGRGSCFTVSLPIVHTGETKENVSTTFTEETILNELDVTHTQPLPQPSPAPQPLTSYLSSQTSTPPSRGELEGGFTSEKPLLLVIDDNADIRLMIKSLLGEEYSVLEAVDGRQGVEIATQYVPDVVLCDVMMPVMDGLECCRLLKQEVATCHIPVLMLTACSLDEQRIEGYDSGADGYISKPFSMAVLGARLRNLIAGRRILDLHYLTKVATTAQPQAATEPLTSSLSSQTSTPPSRLPLQLERAGGEAEGGFTSEAGAGRKKDCEFMQRTLGIIGTEYANPDFGVENLASAVCLSQSQLSRKVKALTGYPPVELIRRFRVEKAHQLLTTTEKSISEIAYQVGFSDPNYFSKHHKLMYGETPKELRTRIKTTP